MNDRERILWSHAEVVWTPAAYELRLPVLLYGRAAHVFRAMLPAWGDRLEVDTVEIDYTPGFIDRPRPGATSAKYGRLVLRTSRQLFALDPQALRDELEHLAADAEAEGDEIDRRDHEIAGPWLEQLRNTSAPGRVAEE